MTQAIEQEVGRGTPSEDASWGRSVNCLGLCVDHRESRTLSVWQADRRVFRVSTLGGFQWGTASAGTYHQARQFDAALLASGGGPGGGAQYPAMAEAVLSPGDAAGTKDRQSGDGQEIVDPFVLDDTPEMGL